MKKSVILIQIILLFTTWVNATGQSKKMTTTLKGTILNPQRDYCLLRQQGRADTIKLGVGGAFELFIEQNTANYFIIEHGKQNIQLYLLPTDEVSLQMNATSLLDAKEISGKSAVYIQYLIEKQKADKADQMAFQSFRIASLSSENFFAKRDSIRNSRQKLLKEKNETHHFLDSFVSIEKKTFDYQMGLELLNFKTNLSKMGTPIQSAQFEAFTASLSLSDEEVTYDSQFRSFALNQVSEVATKRYYSGETKTPLRYYELLIEVLCTTITSEKNKSVLISELMPQLMNDVGTKDLRNVIAILEKGCQDQKLVNSIKKAAAQYEYLYPGKPAPDAGFYDAAGNKSKISSYKGKVIYIDAWATWCGPCKREIPFLKALEEEYHGKNVQFISVSTDKDVNAWKAYIAKESMGGLQLHQSEQFEETISKMYIVNSIPRFIIIDEEGNIVNTDAPRPSSGAEIRTILDGLLAD